MTYIVSYRSPKGKEISLDSILSGEIDLTKPRRARYLPGTITRKYDVVPKYLKDAFDVTYLESKLSDIANQADHFRDLEEHYMKFKIPKRSGGMREICAPNDDLFALQVKLRSVFEKEFLALYHTSAFAYCKGRSIKHCLMRHQSNESKWFLKLDFSDFFGSTNMEFVLKQMAIIDPFSRIMDDNPELMKRALNICFLNDGLPQGTPISPMLTNLIMIPIDHALYNRLHKLGFIYTRYADDIQISHKYKFSKEEVISIVNEVLNDFSAPYQIKAEKTRYGSCSGRNWNLGLMLNKDNNITIGHRAHKQMKARIFNFIKDELNNKPWERDKVEQLAGLIAYYKQIEPKAAAYTIKQIETKLGVCLDNMIRKE